MGKISELDMAIRDLRSAAATINNVADTLAEVFSGTPHTRGTAPGIVNADRNPVLPRSEVYSGVYGRASINFYAFNSNGNKGIACGLNNLQLIRARESLGSKASAESDFATDDDEDFLG